MAAFNWANFSDPTSLNTSNSVVVGQTNPAGVNGSIAAGDFLLAVVAVPAGGDTGEITIPGFTALYSYWDGTSFYRFFVGWKLAGPAETGFYIASWTSGGLGASWLLADFVAVSNAAPVDVTSQSLNDTPSTDMLAASCSPVGAHDLLVGLWGAGGNSGPYAAPGSMTQRADIASTAAFVVELLLATQQLNASGATGTRTATNTAGTISGGFLIALTPAPQYDETISDTAAISDAIAGVLTASTALADSAATADTIIGVLSASVALSDSVAASDSITVILIGSASLSDTASISDTLSAVLTAGVSLSDTTATSDILVSAAHISVALSDTVVTSDNITAVEPLVSEAVRQWLLMSESVRIVRLNSEQRTTQMLESTRELPLHRTGSST